MTPRALGVPAAIALLASSIVAAGCRRASITAATQDSGVEAAPGIGWAGGGCHDNSGCAPDQFCAYTPGLCGKGKKAGACRPKPAGCDGTYAPVCGCNGTIYDSECSAHSAGVDLAVMGGCKPPLAGYAPCGQRYCDARAAYCEIFLSDTFEIPTDYFCRPLPPGCLPPQDAAARTCECFPPETRCSAFCGPLPTAPGSPDGFHLTCQGQRPPTE